MDDLYKSSSIAAFGMKAQATRLRVISENLANADSIGTRPGEDPYRRKTVQFGNILNKQIDADVVKVKRIGTDKSDFRMKLDPGNPAADANGYVKLPNVNPLVEMMDMKEAERSYEANMAVVRTSRSMVSKTIEMLQ
jgi:flagellar basal-body rod protein FlgC